MSKIKEILNQRLSFKDKKAKITALADQSAEGHLTSFTGIFGKAPLNDKEKEELIALLEKFSSEEKNENFSKDLDCLINLTSEVKAINNQAAILHGERIKKAQEILKNYRDGAFSAWLIATYGNRQTPYNFLQYYEFFIAMPKGLHNQIEIMPRQAIYTLASRQGPLQKKEEVVKNYQGESKQQLIELIRSIFPLPAEDGRQKKVTESTINQLAKLRTTLKQTPLRFNNEQKQRLIDLLRELQKSIEECEILE